MRWCTVQRSTICKAKRIRLFALIINCTIMKTNSWFSRNVYAISDRIWCNKHLRHTTTEKYDNNGKDGYFRFDGDNNMSYRYILSITYTEMGQLNTYNPIYCNESIYPELSFDIKIVWLGLLFVLKFGRKPLRNNPKKHDFWTILHAEPGRL